MNLLGRRDSIPYRIWVFTFVTFTMVLAYSNFEVVYEMAHHYAPPPSFTVKI